MNNNLAVLFLLPALLLSGCLTGPPDNRLLDGLLESYMAHSRKISERQQVYRARGIKKLEVSPDSQTAGGFRVSVDLNTASLAVVMDHLVKRTGLEYSFGGSRLAERVTARFNRRPLPEALDILLGPVGYKATISGGVIRITRAALPRTEKGDP